LFIHIQADFKLEVLYDFPPFSLCSVILPQFIFLVSSHTSWF
jgi:hypothetical protein